MVEKFIKYYEEIVMQDKWNKINWIIMLSIIAASSVSVIYEKMIGIGILIFEVILMIIITLIAFSLSVKVVKEIIDKHKLNIKKKKRTNFLNDKEFREIFDRKKKQLINSKLQEERIDRIGQKALIEALYNKYNELCFQNNIFFGIFSFIATACLVLVTMKNDSGNVTIEGLEIYIPILIIAGGFLYMWSILSDRLFFHTFAKKENLKSLTSILEEIYMVKGKLREN